jgi:hypothetical protein
MRTVLRHLRTAWLEYQDTRDGAVFAHASAARLGFENAFMLLPKGASRTTRKASNLVDTKIRVRTFQSGKSSFDGIIGQPGPSDQATLEKWVSSPAVEGDMLVSDPAASHPIDWLVVSGHGSAGNVWGDGAGALAEIDLAEAFGANAAEKRSGRLKCVLVPSCNNVHEDLAPAWLPMFNHAEPVYLLLGYDQSYTGGAIGAHVMAKLVDAIVKNRKVPLIEAWQTANEAMRSPQPWAALVAKGAEAMNVEDWIAGALPVLSNVTELLHFNADHSSGKTAKLVDEKFDVSWVMADGTVIDMSNNSPNNALVGLFAGKKVSIRIKAKQAALRFTKGQEVYLFVYLYRPTKAFDITDLLEVDASLLAPHPDTGQPVVNPEKGRSFRQEAGNVDAFRLVIPADTNTLELGFTVKPSATTKFKADGPGGTHGRFLLDFVHTFEMFDLDEGRQVVAAHFEGSSYAATAGALLRK